MSPTFDSCFSTPSCTMTLGCGCMAAGVCGGGGVGKRIGGGGRMR